ncbi:MAG: HEAT repeat domain-containing protein [Candidatus Hydrogenedentes bacterium]|nr:HEAT repeat domain-containing protein [Candidatus Hydrogenedentota bacterium]MBI3119686.1 HEAT repeat domain-containing protein [Candidatus Hydrogenedentota bacterium]
MQTHRMVPCGLALLLWAAGVQAQVPVTGTSNVTLKQLEGSPTLVTVVLKGERVVEDPNLKVVEVLPNALNVETADGDVFTYLYDTIQEVRVQGEVIEKAEFKLPASRALRADDQKIVERAATRAQSLYETAADNQDVKMNSAVLLRLHEGTAGVEELDYLQQLAQSNDIQTQINAAERLFLAGEDVQEDLIRQGLDSGNRKVKAQTLRLAGLLKYQAGIPQLIQALNDRSDDLAVPAAVALARLGNREIIPRLLNMLTDASEEKGNAAVKALVELGGPEIIEQMKLMLPDAELSGRYRIVLVLFKLGDPLGKKQLQDTLENVPTLALESAILLAASEDEGAMDYLRARLRNRVDPNELNLTLRAKMAAALLSGDDPNAISELQELLRSDLAPVKIAVCDKIIELGNRRLLTILQPTIESSDATVSLHACMAAFSFSYPDYRERLLDMRE